MLSTYKESQSTIEDVSELEVRLSGREVYDFLIAYDRWNSGNRLPESITVFINFIMKQAIFNENSKEKGVIGEISINIEEKPKRTRKNKDLAKINAYLYNDDSCSPELWDEADISILADLVKDYENEREI